MLVEKRKSAFLQRRTEGVGGGGDEGRVSEEAPSTEPISSCHKSFLLGK